MSYFSKERFNELWCRSTVIIDTSVFILLAQSNPTQSKRIMDIFNHISENIWIPCQVKQEVDNLLNNPRVRDGALYRLDKFDERINSHFNKLKIGFSQLSKEMAIEGHDELSQIISDFDPNHLVSKVLSEFRAKKNGISNEFLEFKNQGLLSGFYSEIMKNVGQPLPEDEISSIEKEGIERYNSNPPIPPGFCDKTKKDNRFGDLIVWKEILKKMSQEPGEYIFITADKKDDWFLSDDSGNVIGPHLKLIEEAEAECKESKIDIVYFLDYIQASGDHFFTNYNQLISYLEQYSFIHNKITEIIENELFELIEDDLQNIATDYKGYATPDISEVISIHDATYDNDGFVHNVCYEVEAICYFDYVFDISDRYDDPGDPTEMTSPGTADIKLTVVIPIEGREGKYDPNHLIVDTENWNFEIDSLDNVYIKEPFEDDHLEFEDSDSDWEDPEEFIDELY